MMIAFPVQISGSLNWFSW